MGRTHGWSTLNPLAATAAMLLMTGAAAASDKTDTSKPRLAVLNIQSMDGYDRLSLDLSDAIRAMAHERSSWRVLPRNLSLEQMRLAHGCGPVANDLCMKQIAATLRVDGVLFGQMTRVSGNKRKTTVFRIEMALFDRDAGRIVRRLDTEYRAVRDTAAEHAAHARRIVLGLPGPKSPGGLRLNLDMAGVEVFLDGESLGTTDANGVFIASDLPPGDHALSIYRDGTQLGATNVTIPSGRTASLTLNPLDMNGSLARRDAGRDVSWRQITGWTAIGLGGVFLGMTAYSWIRINQIDKSDTLASYRQRVPADVTDICADPQPYARPGEPEFDEFTEVQRLCNQANGLENVWQWVFLGLGAASTGAGAYLVASDYRANAEQPPTKEPPIKQSARLRFLPSVNIWGGGVDAKVTF